MPKLICKYLFAALVFLFTLTGSTFAQIEGLDEIDNRIEDESYGFEEEFSFGTVLEVSEDRIKVLEYDFDKEEEVEIIYQITGETILENAANVNDIAANDEVEINFVEEDAGKIATFILKDIPLEDDEFLNQDTQQ